MSTDQNMFQMFTSMHLVVQLIILLLMSMSVYSWLLIGRMSRALFAIKAKDSDFETEFWSGNSLNEIFDSVQNNEAKAGAIGRIFVNGMREYSKIREKKIVDKVQIIEGVRRAMKASLMNEKLKSEAGLSFLATAGAVSMYIGLFGTAWGLMHLFNVAASAQHAVSLEASIGQTLIASVLGLFVSIPAITAYNFFTSSIDQITVRCEAFTEEFLNILSRNVSPN